MPPSSRESPSPGEEEVLRQRVRQREGLPDPGVKARLDESEQKAILGPGKFRMYSKGDLKLPGMVKEAADERWRPYRIDKPLKDLTKERAGADAAVVKRVADHTEVRRLVKDALETGRAWTDEELDAVIQHVAGAWFDPAKIVRAGKEIAGLEWGGRKIVAGESVPTDAGHYLKHVHALQQWPASTSFDQYRASARSVALDPASGVAVNLYRWQPHITIARRSGDLRGVGGGPGVLVEYRVKEDAIRTVFQPRGGVSHLNDVHRTGITWMRKAKP
ncbi:MAG TPA: hypothetical protein VGM37_19795 [Armatimonadota bacterium]|jgi:hypothetical protein